MCIPKMYWWYVIIKNESLSPNPYTTDIVEMAQLYLSKLEFFLIKQASKISKPNKGLIRLTWIVINWIFTGKRSFLGDRIWQVDTKPTDGTTNMGKGGEFWID